MKQIGLVLLMALPFFPAICYTQLNIEEHMAMENILSPKVNSNKILYCKITKESWDGKMISQVVISDQDGENLRELTSGEFDYDPRWSPDGKLISFISYRNNLQQIYVVPAEGGKLKMTSDAQGYLSNYKWLNNSTIAYVDDEPRDSTVVAKENENGGGYWIGTEYYTNALWLYDINTDKKKKITNGKYRIIDFDLSSDGKRVAILGAKNYDTYESITHSWVRVLNIDDGNLVYEFQNARSFNNISFSPSGRFLTFAGSTEGFSINDGLFVADLDIGQTDNLIYELDRTIEKVHWKNESTILFTSPKDGYTELNSVQLDGTIDTSIGPYWVIYDFEHDPVDEAIFFVGSRSSSPKQLYVLGQRENPEAAFPLTHLNESILKKIKSSTEILRYQSHDGTMVQGIVTFPPGYDKTRTYPLMTIPHGGPDAIVMDDYNLEGQFFADNGYLVFQPNFRGSIGFGRSFYAGNRAAFGKTDFEDIISGINRLIEEKKADQNNLFIGGWSYGGYMSNWAITQTNIFNAAISIAGVSNLVSLYGQHEFSNRDIGIWEYKGLPLDNVETYRRSSPIFLVKNVETPLLILHGSNDSRSPTLQAWEMYRAMTDAGKTVKMMLYPQGGHSISNPIQRKSVMTNWLNWANMHISRH
jgi:dipeptidyl aminopeptidase/acylaminoacyl peptidase